MRINKKTKQTHSFILSTFAESVLSFLFCKSEEAVPSGGGSEK